MVAVPAPLVTVNWFAVKLVIEPLVAVSLVVLTVNALKLPIDPDAAVVQLTPPTRGTPFPHITTFVVPVAKAELGINAAGKVITNPELINIEANTRLIVTLLE